MGFGCEVELWACGFSGFIGISEWFFNRDIGASVGSNGVGRSRGLLCSVSSGLTPCA